ncbi:calcium-binding protein [Nitrospira sp. M1]
MAISRDLFLAILSMDSYNRGYNAGINDGGANDPDGLGGLGSKIGNATVIEQDISPEAQAAGFYAVAYEWNGETIISYRGTDSFATLPWNDQGGDFWNGYGTGAGSGTSEQARLAAEFYQAVTGTQTGNPLTGSATLTGHSLGGGLAGFIGALYHEDAKIFNSMPFELAVETAYGHADTRGAVWDQFRKDFYNDEDPFAPLLSTNLQGYAVTGELLDILTAGRVYQDMPTTYYDSHAFFQNPVDLHSQALLTTLMFGQEHAHLDWESIGPALINAIFTTEVAEQAGFKPADTQGRYSETDKMLSAIAYSALDTDDHGNGTLVFGNTGIRALFDDADELGKLVTEGKIPTAHGNPLPDLAKAIVQFAGQMALGEVNYKSHTDWRPEEGFLGLSNNDTVLKADLAKDLWNIGADHPDQDVMVDGIQTIVNNFFIEEVEADTILAAMQELYGSAITNNARVINRIDFALESGSLTVELAERGNDPERGGNPPSYDEHTTSLFVALGEGDQIDGNSDNNIIVARGGEDTLYGRTGKDIIVGGTGKDRIIDLVTEESADGRSNEDDVYIGGSSDDTVEYRLSDEREGTSALAAFGLSLAELDHNATLGSTDAIKLTITDQNSGKSGTDYLVDIENVILSERGDEVVVEQAWLDADLELDLGKAGGGADTIFTRADYDRASFANFSQGTVTEDGATRVGDSALRISGAEELILTDGKDRFDDTMRFGKIDAGKGNDTIIVKNPEYLTAGSLVHPGVADSAMAGEDLRLEIYGGDHDDTIHSFGGEGTKIFGGDGNDTIWSTTFGAEVQGGDGQDTFWLSKNTLITDAKPEDRISFFGLWDLTGGVKNKQSESSWAYNPIGAIHYGKNTDGELVIWSPLTGGSKANPNATYVANAKVDPTDPFSERTAGLLVIEIEVEVRKGWEGWSQGLFDFFETFFGYYMKAMTGKSYFSGVDPLVLDLDGDGLELTARTTQSPLFDLDGDGFAEQTGWVQSDDGLLVHDINGNGEIDDIRELFGSPTTSGFEELAEHDTNENGVIDINDAIFSELRVWQDLNQNAKVDEGELSSLEDAGIESISLTATASSETNANNLVAETGSFTRTDGTTNEIADIKFKINNYDSKWLGDSTIDPTVAHLPNLTGHGTLNDLHVALTLDATGNLKNTLDSVLPTLATPKLETLRERTIPVLEAWAAAVPVQSLEPVDPNTPPQPQPDVHAFVYRTPGATIIEDFAVQNVDGSWALASGTTIRDAAGETILQPTIEDILAFLPAAEGAWETIEGRQIEFLERFMGEEIAIERVEAGNDAAIAALQGTIEFMIERMDVLAVKLAMQGPLQSYFVGLEYQVEHDRIKATTNRDLVPTFEAIFADAPGETSGDSAWLQDWKAILDVMGESFQRFGDDHLTPSYSFVFTNIVAAYENVGLAIDLKTAAIDLGIPEDMLVVGSGEVVGDGGQNLIYLGAGDQILKGEGGHDVYVVGRDFGNDIIDDYEAPLTKNSEDMLRFAHYTPEDLVFTRDGIDLVVTTVNNPANELRILEHFIGEKPHLFGGNVNPDRGINEVIFADGTVWRAFEIAEAVSRPLDTDQSITGTWESDHLDGGAGDDYLSGGDGGDIYFFDEGYGHDVAQDRLTYVLVDDPDFLVFGQDIAFDDVSFSRQGSSHDIVVTLDQTGDTLTLQGFADATYTGSFGTQWFDRIEYLIFADGTALQWFDVLTQVVAEQKTDEDDTIYGFDYQDVLDGGAGNDYLSGGNENDTYIYDVGYGHDTIEDNLDNILSGQTDTVRFGSGVELEQVTFTRNGNSSDVIIGVSAEDTLTVSGQFDATYTGSFGTRWFDRIEAFEFLVNGETVTLTAEDVMRTVLEDGRTDGDDTIYGFSREDVLDGGAGDDYLSGGNENDTYIFDLGYDHDVIKDSQDNILSGSTDTIQFGAEVALDQVIFDRDGNSEDLIVRVSDTDSVTARGQFNATYTGVFGVRWFDRIEQFQFDIAGETVTLSASDVMGRVLEDKSTDGDDVIYGFSREDVLDGGAGDDYLSGGDENDTYIFGLGYGHDTIREGRTSIFSGNNDKVIFTGELTPDDITLSREGNADTLDIFLNDGSQLTVKGYFAESINFNSLEEFYFEGSETSLFMNDIQLRLLADAQTDGDDTIYGFEGDDVLDGGAGNDYLSGCNGNDTYMFGLGYGHDTIREARTSIFSGDDDKVIFTGALTPDDIRLSREGSSNTVTVHLPDGSTLTIEGYFGGNANFNRIKELYFEGSDSSLFINDLKTQVLADAKTSGDDVIDGFVGSDRLDGGAGDDYLRGNSGNDVYVFDRGYGHDTVSDSFVSILHANTDTIEFGGTLTPDDLWVSRDDTRLVIEIKDTADTLTIRSQYHYTGWYSIEQFAFADGQVLSKADMTARTMLGSDEDNDIAGTDGDNLLDGGGGDDMLTGHDGSDTYVYDLGDGHDVIVEGEDALGRDVIQLGAGLVPVDLTLERIGTQGLDVRLHLQGIAGSMVLKNQLAGSGQGIEELVFHDGTVWAGDDLLARLLADASTDGDDTIYGFEDRSDVIDGGAGDDVLHGLSGDDVLYGGDGDDTLSGGDGLDSFDGGLGSDTVDYRESLDDLVVNLDQQNVSDSNTVETFVSIENAIGGSGNDRFVGSSGANVFGGMGGSDTYVFGAGAGHDVIQENGAEEDIDRVELSGLTEADVSVTRSGHERQDLLLTINATGETLTMENYFIDAAHGVEVIQFADGSQWDRGKVFTLVPFVGTNGDDTIWGTPHDDVFVSSLGNDMSDGQEGGDMYYYASGHGSDTVEDTGTVVEDHDSLQFSDLSRTDLTFARTAADLFVTVIATQHVLQITNQFTSGGLGLEQIVFSDGEAWNRSDIETLVTDYANALNGTAADDTITGTSSANTLVGQKGNDTLHGKKGSDTYIFTRGDGQDVIEDNGWFSTDRLLLNGYTTNEVHVSREGTSTTIVLTFVGTEDQVRIIRALDGWADGLEQIVFEDGTIWTPSTLQEKILTEAITDGDDTIVGFETDDVLTGGLGNDMLHGKKGSDTYHFTRGDGLEVIEDNGWYSTDTLRIHGYAPHDVSLNRVGTSYTIELGFSETTDRVTLVNGLLDGHDEIEQIVFDDGTVWTSSALSARVLAEAATDGDETIVGFETADVLTGGLGNDTLHGKKGSDTYVFTRGDGQDVIEDNGWFSTDRLLLNGYTPNEVQVSREGTSTTIVLTFVGTEDQVRIIRALDGWADGLEQIVFEDGTLWTPSILQERILTEAITEGDDTIVGFESSDVLAGGLGNDTLHGDDGSDTYVFTRGDGQDLIEDNGWYDTDKLLIHGYTPEEVRLQRDGGYSVILSFLGTDDEITIVNEFTTKGDMIEEVHFDDGTVWTEGAMRDQVVAQETTAGDDVIVGYNWADELVGGLGNDTLHGEDGSDTYVFTRGDGQDRIDDNGWYDTDKLVLHDYATEDVNLSREGNYTIVLTFLGTEDRVTLVNGITTKSDRIEQIVFDDGTVWTESNVRSRLIDGTSVSDVLAGTEQGDLLTGFAGDDILTGGTGNDTFVFRDTIFGHDTVTDFTAGEASDDVVETNAFTSFEDVLLAASDDGANTTITIDAENSITLENVLVSHLHQDDFQFV